MDESPVFFLLDKLADLLQEEVKLLGGVKKDVEYIRDELKRMSAFLIAADEMKKSEPELQVWVKQVQDVACDTEDVLNDFMLHLADHHHGNRLYGFLCKVFHCIKSLKARHRIASKIHDIKSRVGDIAEGHQRYLLKFNISKEGSGSTVVNDTWYDPRGDALLIGEAELVGIDKPKQELIRLLVVGERDSKRRVVSVFGSGGLGKTTLVKKVYDDASVKKHFRCHVWLTVSESPQEEELLRDMIQQLFSELKQSVPRGLEKMKRDQLKVIINEILMKRRYLVVLDDIWSNHGWDFVKYALPNNSCGSGVMLTTRYAEIASMSCVETDDYVFAMKPLPKEESWTLFCRKAFPGSSCPPHLEEISRSILQRCEGLPLAIVAIGGVLATKNKNAIDEWEMFQRSLELQSNEKLESLKNILSLSYNGLPYHLKICYLYLSIFPEDHQIECMRLIRLWMAEGFVQVSNGKTLEEVAQGYIHELVNRSLMEATEIKYGRVRKCRIHLLLGEIIISKSREKNIVAIANQQNQTWPEKVRRLSMHNILVRVQRSKRFSQLRSLLMFGVADPLSSSSMPTLFRGDLRFLKVLDLRGASLETVPNEIFELFHLRYLSLRGTKVKMLPKSIGNLRHLETLDLKNTNVTELPVEIQRLRALRHLLIYNYSTFTGHESFHNTIGFKAKIAGLSSLQKLCYIEASDDKGGNIVGELQELTQLKRLAIVKLRREDGMALCSSIEKLSKLRSLALNSKEEEEILDIESLSSPPRFLQGLYLFGRLEKSPHWIHLLHNLVRLKLWWSKLTDDPLQSLPDLPNLVDIELFHAYEGEELFFKAGGFKSLKRLWLGSLKGLRWMRVEEGSMPQLEKLCIYNCKLVEEVPSGIEHLTKLQLLQLSDMPNELLMKLDRSRGGADYSKIAHIPNVLISFFQDCCWTRQFL